MNFNLLKWSLTLPGTKFISNFVNENENLMMESYFLIFPSPYGVIILFWQNKCTTYLQLHGCLSFRFKRAVLLFCKMCLRSRNGTRNGQLKRHTQCPMTHRYFALYINIKKQWLSKMSQGVWILCKNLSGKLTRLTVPSLVKPNDIVYMCKACIEAKGLI